MSWLTRSVACGAVLSAVAVAQAVVPTVRGDYWGTWDNTDDESGDVSVSIRQQRGAQIRGSFTSDAYPAFPFSGTVGRTGTVRVQGVKRSLSVAVRGTYDAGSISGTYVIRRGSRRIEAGTFSVSDGSEE